MKALVATFIVMLVLLQSLGSQSYETRFSKPLGQVLQEISNQFNIKLSYDIDTVGKVVPYADFRIRPYSVEESLNNVLALFDYKFVKQNNNSYKLRSYEYMRRTPADGAKMLAWLNGLYPDSISWENRRACLKKEIREKLQIDQIMAQRVKNVKPILSKVRKYNGYNVQNFALETLPGLFVNGSIYMPDSKGKHALILCPNGHWSGGRYNSDEQTRFATLARMGAICVSYDLFGWGESELQVGTAAHRTPEAHIIQIMNGLSILDYMLTRKDTDPARIGANGGSGGGSQVILLTVLDERFSAACPTVNLASHFDGGCPCESGMPIQLACGGTNNAEQLALFAPKPVCVISDGGDWTASVPELEYPYLQRIWQFYNAGNQLSNVHLPTEKHDFGPNKRKAVYQFFAETFKLDSKRIDEKLITVEPTENMLSFGIKGEKMPSGAVRTSERLRLYFQ